LDFFIFLPDCAEQFAIGSLALAAGIGARAAAKPPATIIIAVALLEDLFIRLAF
jgi:hypothetical protein